MTGEAAGRYLNSSEYLREEAEHHQYQFFLKWFGLGQFRFQGCRCRE